MTATPRQQRGEDEAQNDPVEKLTDDAITNERAKIKRMIDVRKKKQRNIANLIVSLEARDELLIAAQIERLKKQSRASVTPQGEQQGGGE